MATRTDAWPAGTPCFVDLMAPAGPDYGTFTTAGASDPCGDIGGLMGDGPSRWLVYVEVADTDAAVAAVEQAGAP